MNYLIFNLYGPMAAWGDIAVGGVRPSHRYPTKSAVMGLLAAAQGIKRNQEDELQSLQNSLGFAVRLDIQGQLITDYHTSQVPTQQALKNYPHYTRRDGLMASELATVLSTREYYCDAHYTIVLWPRNKNFPLLNLKQYLQYPAFTPYLGRKSCPISMPILPHLCEASTVEEALLNYDDTPIVQNMRAMLACLIDKNSNTLLYTDIDAVMRPNSNYQHTEIRRDLLFNRKRWQHAQREENLIMLNKQEG